ncbi:hypothetical protein [Ruegeria arenilitoris]|nr:hypothetical protein [Ruegeria arenilitoris]
MSKSLYPLSPLSSPQGATLGREPKLADPEGPSAFAGNYLSGQADK